MLLQVVSHPGDISRDLEAIGQAHAGDLAQRRVGLLGRSGFHLRTHAAFLRAGLELRRLALEALLFPGSTNELINCRHSSYAFPIAKPLPAAPAFINLLSYNHAPTYSRGSRILVRGGKRVFQTNPQGNKSPLGEIQVCKLLIPSCQSPAGTRASTDAVFSISSASAGALRRLIPSHGIPRGRFPPESAGP